jgi:hypothetical protein
MGARAITRADHQYSRRNGNHDDSGQRPARPPGAAVLASQFAAFPDEPGGVPELATNLATLVARLCGVCHFDPIVTFQPR